MAHIENYGTKCEL